jgi:hypothetical protein
MGKTVKRALWQRTLEAAGPLRQPLPKAPESKHEPAVLGMDAGAGDDTTVVTRSTVPVGKLMVHELADAYVRALVADTFKDAAAEFKKLHLGQPWATGGEHRGGVRLVGEGDPESRGTIPVGMWQVGASAMEAVLARWQLDLVRQLNEGSTK